MRDRVETFFDIEKDSRYLAVCSEGVVPVSQYSQQGLLHGGFRYEAKLLIGKELVF